MPYLTELNGALIEVQADGSIVTIPPTTVLNDFGNSMMFDQYEVQDDATGAENVVAGDYIGPIVNGEPEGGTYLGSGSMSNLGLSVGSPSGGIFSPNLGISAALNPIEGDFMSDEDGNVFMITDQPLNAEHLGVSLTIKLPLLAAITIEVPLSELNATLQSLDPAGLLGPLLGGTTDLAQYLLDTAVVSLDFDAEGSMELDESEIVVCYLAGTKIMTDAGPVAIEELREGQQVVCRSGGLRPILWIGRQHFVEDRAAGHEPIRFAPGSLGVNVPREALLVSPGHSMMVGECLVLAKDLVNGITITREAPRRIWSYFQLDLGVHDLILANGTWSESFADCEGFREKFDNYSDFKRRHPDHIPPVEPALCARRPESGPELHDAVQSVAMRTYSLHSHSTFGRVGGGIDAIRANRFVSGWAMDLDYPDRPVMLEIMLDDVVIGTSIACVWDRNSGASGKKHFLFDAGRDLTQAEQLQLTVRRAQDKAALAPLPDGTIGELEGHLDLISEEGLIEGWARSSANPDQPVLLDVVIGDEVIGVVLASQKRRDLSKAGLGPVAFTFQAERVLSADEIHRLEVRSSADGAILRRTDETCVETGTQVRSMAA